MRRRRTDYSKIPKILGLYTDRGLGSIVSFLNTKCEQTRYEPDYTPEPTDLSFLGEYLENHLNTVYRGNLPEIERFKGFLETYSELQKSREDFKPIPDIEDILGMQNWEELIRREKENNTPYNNFTRLWGFLQPLASEYCHHFRRESQDYAGLSLARAKQISYEADWGLFQGIHNLGRFSNTNSLNHRYGIVKSPSKEEIKEVLDDRAISMHLFVPSRPELEELLTLDERRHYRV